MMLQVLLGFYAAGFAFIGWALVLLLSNGEP